VVKPFLCAVVAVVFAPVALLWWLMMPSGWRDCTRR
jgi:K+ transporter